MDKKDVQIILVLIAAQLIGGICGYFKIMTPTDFYILFCLIWLLNIFMDIQYIKSKLNNK